MDALTADLSAQNRLLSQINACVVAEEGSHGYIDVYAVSGLDSLSSLPSDKQRAAANFISQALLANAGAGFAPSQHNYASLFNAPPGSLLARLIPQSQATFGLWTRLAASQGEPRAIFNLAMRMAVGTPQAGIARDQETSYQLLVNLREFASRASLSPAGRRSVNEMLPIVAGTMQRLEQSLGATRASQLRVQASRLDYAALAPR